MWTFFLAVVLGAAAAGINYLVVDSLWFGYFQTTYNHAAGTCRKLHETENGSEDIAVLRNGLAFISSGLRLSDSEVYSSRKGKLFLFDMKDPQSHAEELEIKAADDFNLVSPHGLSTWTADTTGTVYLYVISHQQHETVDKFLFNQSSKTLQHKRRIENVADFVALNNLAVVDAEQFYFTNKYRYWLTMEVVSRLRFGSVGYYNGSHSKLVATNLFIPNGIAVSPDGRTLYVAVMGDKEIRVYEILGDSIALRTVLYTSIQVSTHVDNLNVDLSTGDIWLGAHPDLIRSGLYTTNPAGSISPSQVLRVKMIANPSAWLVEEIFSNNGTEISGSSVAVVHETGLLIGSVASAAYYCQR